MTAKSSKNKNAATKMTREERLAQSLRDNLRRRKQAARKSKSPAEDTPQ